MLYEVITIRLDIVTEHDRVAFASFPRQTSCLFSHLAVQLPILGVDHAGAARNISGAVVGQAIKIIVFTHVPEKILLTPSSVV